MHPEENYIDINRASWNKRTGPHIRSAFYNLEGFMQGQLSLTDIELHLLGDIQGKTVLHLQCHFGMDTISLTRLGAVATGVDFSDEAIGHARRIAGELNAAASFICCDVYDLPNHLHQQFDIVFTSFGVIGWLPDLDKWAAVINRFLKPGGRLVFAEFHPVVWMFDNDFKYIQYPYFKAEAIVETESGTYADKSAAITQQYITWNHALSEVISSLLKQGLEITAFEEYDHSPYNCFNNTVEIAPKKYRIAALGDKIPMVYSIVAEKKIPV